MGNCFGKSRQFDKKRAPSLEEKKLSSLDFAAGRLPFKREEIQLLHENPYHEDNIKKFRETFKEYLENIKNKYFKILGLLDGVEIYKRSGLNKQSYKLLSNNFNKAIEDLKNSDNRISSEIAIKSIIERAKEAIAILNKLDKLEKKVKQPRKKAKSSSGRAKKLGQTRFG